MARHRIGMRWWLGGTFVLIAALTAALVAGVSSRQADQAVRANSEDLAVGKTVSAAFAVQQAVDAGNLDKALPVIAGRRGLALFVFTRDGRLLAAGGSRGLAWRSVPHGRAALAAALGGHRFVLTTQAHGATLTALPLRRTSLAQAVVAYAPRPAAYGRSLAIFRREAVRAALWAVLVAAAAGLLAASLIARRLRRIDAAAASIAQGDFGGRLEPRFHDEVGSLALSIERMRRGLRISFEQVRAERDRLGRLLEQLHEGVLAVDEQLVVRFANETAQDMLALAELTPGSPLPKTWAGVPLREVARGLFRDDAEVAEARASPDERQTFSIVGVPARASELAVLVLTDVTEQERRERAEREFVANASHELRTPVSAIVGAVEALQAGAKDSPEDREMFVALIERQATRLGRLIRSMLILARAQTQQGRIQLEPVELAPLLDEIAASTEGDVAVDCPPGIVALAQRDVAEQIVSNLLGNAVKHSPAGTVHLSARSANGNVVIEVADRGPGIPPEAQRLVFDRFYSGEHGRRDGFGLGLAIAREAVRALGGSIEIDSGVGRGTTARVTLATGRR